MLPWPTVLDDVMCPLKAVTAHRRQRRAQHPSYKDIARKRLGLLCLAGLVGYDAPQPQRPPGGMQQCARLRSALIHEPSLQTLNEPFGAQHMLTREVLWFELQRLCINLKPSVMVVTNDLRQAVCAADRALMRSGKPGRFNAGRVVPIDRPPSLDDLYTAHYQAFMQELRVQTKAARQAERAVAAPAHV